MTDTKLKKRIQEGITNIANLGQIPKDEVQLNLDVLYNSVLNDICSVVPMESPRQIISCLKLTYGSENKSLLKLTGDVQKDAYAIAMMNGVGAVPFNDYGYPTDEVHVSVSLNANNQCFVTYNNIIPGTVKIDDKYTDNGFGNIVDGENGVVGVVDYVKGVFTFNAGVSKNLNITYKYDIYNLEYNPNTAKFVKTFVEVSAEMYNLDINTAVSLDGFKTLDLKHNIDNIIPQILAQQIDQNVINKFFKQAELQVVDNFDTSIAPTVYSDIGTFVCNKMGEYTAKHGVVPNVILCNATGFSLLSANLKFVAVNDEEHKTAGTPKFVGYFNGAKVIVSNNVNNAVDIILTFRGDSDALAAGVFTPFIPVALRTVAGAEGGGTIITTNAYSMAGFAMINPDLVEGIKVV